MSNTKALAKRLKTMTAEEAQEEILRLEKSLDTERNPMRQSSLRERILMCARAVRRAVGESPQEIALTQVERLKYAEYAASMQAMLTPARSPEDWVELYRKIQARIHRERKAGILAHAIASL